jgi:hypothetical protein
MKTSVKQRTKRKAVQSQSKIRGCYRLQITEKDGRVVGDSGWIENQITNLGFNEYLVSTLGAIAGSKQVGFMALGTGSVPGAAATTLNGELDQTSSRAAVTAATSSSSKALRFTATFSSANSFTSATVNISNIGLFNTSAVTTGTLFAGNTYASSSCATNQNVNATYDITFT